MSNSLEQLAHDVIDAWNAHDARRVAAFFAENYVGEDVGVTGQLRGPRDVRRLVMFNTLGIPDFRFELDDVITQGDRMVLVWTMLGTHMGSVMNIPATGQTFAARGVSVLTVREGLITRSLRIWDVAGMFRQFGLLPDAPALHDGT